MKSNENTKKAKEQNIWMGPYQKFKKIRKWMIRFWKYKESQKEENTNGPFPKGRLRPNALLQNASFIGTDKSRSAFIDQSHKAE